MACTEKKKMNRKDYIKEYLGSSTDMPSFVFEPSELDQRFIVRYKDHNILLDFSAGMP
jgi:hypothetical protein